MRAQEGIVSIRNGRGSRAEIWNSPILSHEELTKILRRDDV